MAFQQQQDDLEADDKDDEDSDDDGDKPNKKAALEYKRLIAIHAGKPKGGLDGCLHADPDKVRRLSLSEQQLEKAIITHGKQIVRFAFFSVLMIHVCSRGYSFMPLTILIYPV